MSAAPQSWRDYIAYIEPTRDADDAFYVVICDSNGDNIAERRVSKPAARLLWSSLVALVMDD